MKKIIPFIFILLSLFSCKKISTQERVNATFNHKILDGYLVTAIAFDNQGNTWVGTNSQGLIKYNSNEIVVYNASNSIIPDSASIYDIQVDSKNNIWIGTKGLIKYDGNVFTLYNSKNSPIPEDYVNSIAIDSKDNIWFGSSSVLEGGLVKYDGTTWTVYTPDNSDLPVNLIGSIAIDKTDNVWLTQSQYTNDPYLLKISNDTWTIYSSNDFGFTPYYFGNIRINTKNQACCSISYILGEPLSKQRPEVFIFNGSSSTQLKFDDTSIIKSLMVDNKDNIWCICLFGVYSVYDGQNWYIDSKTFSKIGVSTIAQSPDSKIWIGTGDGIFINN